MYQQPSDRPPQYQPDAPTYLTPQVPPPPPKKRSLGKFFAIGCGALAAFVVLIIAIAVAASSGNSSTTTTSQPTQAASQPTQAPTRPAKPTAKPTQAPTVSPAQLEAVYKASTTDISVVNLDKDGNNDKGKDVHFTATILNFVKDDSGNTAGANVTDPNDASSVIQVGFPIGTDVSQLNTGDTLEVWGLDGGTSSGTNAFGATIQEVVVAAQYMTDKTTGYQAG